MNRENEIRIKIQQKLQRVAEFGLQIAQLGESNIDFTALSELSQDEQNVLPVSIESLRQSFHDNMSAVLLKDRTAVGHARFIPLLDERLITDLGLPTSTPQIWEMGTGLMLPEVRGKGINIVLRHVLISRFRDQMTSGRMLVIATTKTPELRSLVDNMADLLTDPEHQYPLDFRFTNRENLPFIAPFTCICTPDFGTGYQFGTSCNQAEVASQNTVAYRRGMELPLINNGSNGSKIACTVFLSSTKLAEETEMRLSERFGTQQNLVHVLKERRYF
jgi:hypothetical protein